MQSNVSSRGSIIKTAQHSEDSQITVEENRGENAVRTTQGFLEVEQAVGVPSSAEWVHIWCQLQKAGSAKRTTWVTRKHRSEEHTSELQSRP